jgi:hypothetical protein
MIVGICLHQSHHQGRCQLISIMKPPWPAQWRILLQIDHGSTARGLHYRPNCSTNTAIHSRRRSLLILDTQESCFAHYVAYSCPMLPSNGTTLCRRTAASEKGFSIVESAKRLWKSPAIKNLFYSNGKLEYLKTTLFNDGLKRQGVQCYS